VNKKHGLIILLISLRASIFFIVEHFVDIDRTCAEIEMRYLENPELARTDPGFLSYEEYRDNLVKIDPLNGLIC